MRSGAATAHGARGARREPILSWALLALGILLRFVLLDHQSLWADEVESLYRSWGKDLSQALARTRVDYHPPLFFVLLWVWNGLDGPDAMARGLSALIGSAFLPVAYALGRRLGGPRTALWTLALAALSPLHIWYSQEVRQYGLLVLLAGISWLLFFALLERPSARRWLALGAVFAAGSLTHVYFVFLPLAQLPVLWLWRRRALTPDRGTLRTWVAVHALAGALLVPVALWKIGGITGWSGAPADLGPALMSMRRLETGNIGGLSPLALPYTFFTWSAGYSLGPPIASLHLLESAAQLFTWGPEIVLVGVLFGGAALLGLRSLRREPLAAAAVIGGIAVPLAAALLLTALTAVAFHPRYALAGFPLFLVLLGRGVGALGPRRAAALGAGLLAFSALADVRYYADPAYAREDARGVVRHLERNAQAGDLVIVEAYLRPYTHYLDPPTPVDLGVEGESPWFPLYERGPLRLAPLRSDYATPEGAAAFWALLPEPKERLWLVTSERWKIDPEGDLRSFLAPRYRSVRSRAFPQIELTLLERRR